MESIEEGTSGQGQVKCFWQEFDARLLADQDAEGDSKDAHLKVLLNNTGQLDFFEADGKTVLHLAAAGHHLEAVQAASCDVCIFTRDRQLYADNDRIF